MKNFSSTILSLLLIFLIAFPTTAFADAATAQVFYESAANEYGKGNYGKAAELLYKAYVNDANLIYAYNRILALQADKQYTAALKELEVFEKQMMNDSEKRFEDVPEIKSKLQAQVETAVNVKKDPVVKNKTKDDDNKTKKKDDKDDKTVTPPSETGMNSSQVAGLTIAGGGAIILGVGILFVTGELLDPDLKNRVRVVRDYIDNNNINEDDDTKKAQAIKKSKAYDSENCSPFGSIGQSCAAIYSDEESKVSLHETIALTGIIAGSALIIGGGILYLVSGDDTPTESAQSGEFNFAPYVSTEGAGATFQLTF